MSKQLMFSALVGIPTSLILGVSRWCEGSHWWILWAAIGGIHINIIADEIRPGATKRAIGFSAAWLLFSFGQIVSRPMIWWDWPVYPLFNWLMCASTDVQDWGGAGPWEKVNHALD